ncbi:MAG: carboxypeptidase-like regulatory domain-containing protein, partial [Bryobacteraceae bacterium]
MFCIALLTPIEAQLSNSTIKGTVTDATGGVLTNATVTLLNSGTGEHRQQATNQQGNYDFTALSPGQYEIKVTAPGFGEWSGELTLRVAQEAEIKPVLQTASLSTSVYVK